MNLHEFYRVLYEKSPIETATVVRVHKTLTDVPWEFGEKNVQIPHYNCDIITDSDHRRFENVPWVSAFVDPHTGAGTYTTPRARTKVLIGYGRGGQVYIIGWLAPVGLDGRHTANRLAVPDGSSVMSAAFGNRIVVFEGGVIRIQSTPQCRRTYNPSFDTIRDFCRNYFLISSTGTFSMTESKDRQRRTTMLIETFDKADAATRKTIRTQRGYHSDKDPGQSELPKRIFSFLVGEGTEIFIDPEGKIVINNENPEAPETADISINNDGALNLSMVKGFSVDTETGAISFQAGTGGNTKIEMQPDGNVDIESASFVNIKAPTVQLEANLIRTTGRTILANGGRPASGLTHFILTDPGGSPPHVHLGRIIQGSPSVSID